MAEAAAFLGEVRGIPGVRAAFTGRVTGVPLTEDKWKVLEDLEPSHREVVHSLGFEWEQLWRAEQVHGAGLEVVPGSRSTMVPAVDGLLTGRPGVLLGIYVADCAAVFLADGRTGALGLVHSGKKGTEANIAGRAVERMGEEFGTDPLDVKAVISPCIRPPLYEVDFAAAIRAQLEAAGVPSVHDPGTCTGADVGHYYSYRVERGRTGRMLALLGRVEGTEA